MAKKGRKYAEALKLVDRTKKYNLDEAIELVKKTSYAKFDATVELAFNLNLNPKKAEQNLRGAIVLPHGSGKTRKVLVLAKGAKIKEAEEHLLELEKLILNNQPRLGKPEFLILDEPINGLDPEGVAEIRKLINHLSQDKKITILISSHILSELSKVATKYGFIHKGKLVQEISAEELENRVSKKTLIIVNDVAEATKLLDDKKIKYSMSSKPNEIILDGGKTIKEVNEIFNGTNIEVTDIKVNQEDLESYYINLVNSSSKGV